ncbi:MAG: DMT family transporter [bacterium]
MSIFTVPAPSFFGASPRGEASATGGSPAQTAGPRSPGARRRLKGLTQHPLYGFVLLFLSAFIFSVMIAAVKLATPHVPVGQLVFCRFFLGFAALSAVRSAGLVAFAPVNRGGLLLRGLFGGVAVLCYFVAVYGGTITNAAVLNSTYPMFVAMFSAVYIGERVRGRLILPLAAAFLGVVLIISPAGDTPRLSDLAGLVSGVCAGLAILTVRRLRKTDSVWTIVYYFNIVGSALTAPLLVADAALPSAKGAMFAVLVSLLANLAQFLLTTAYRHTRAAEGSVVTLTTPVFSAAWGVLLFGEPLGAAKALGGALVLGTGFFLSASSRENSRSRKESRRRRA